MTKMTAEQVAADISRREQESIEKGNNSDDWIAVGMAAARGLIEDNLIETDEQRRERFEAWLWGFVLGKMDEHERDVIANASDEKRADAKSKLFARGDDGEYEQVDLEQSWISWQAALTWRGETKGGE